MTTTHSANPASGALPSKEVLRRNVIDRLNDLEAEELAALHDALLRAAKQRLWKDISSEAGADHRAGLMEQLPEFLRQVRAAIDARS